MPSITADTDLYSLTADDLAPYASLYLTWSADRGVDPESARGTWSAVTAAPGQFTWHLGAFRTWLLENQPAETVLPAADRQSTANALAAMRRRERDAKADAHQARQDLIAARQEVIRLREQAAQPFNSEHPQWREFWLTAARNATRSGHCPEYDRHAELMGGITRDQFREEGVSLYNRENVTYTITVSFTYTDTVDSGDDSWVVNAGGSDLARLAYDNRYDLTDYTVEEEEREEVDEG